jgi:uncharacterized protein (DUF362 family)
LERVSVVRCPSTSSDAEVVRRAEEAVRALGDYGRGLRGARKIAVKVNAGIARARLTDGRQTELTDPAVVEGVIRAIRDVTDAEIVLGDAPTERPSDPLSVISDQSGRRASVVHPIYEALGYPERLAPYGVRLVNFGEGELVEVPMRHDGAMFSRYWLHRELAEADAFVSIAKMKAHVSMGVTLCIKNLFGWTPPGVYGAPRMYLHDRLIRLPRVLADLAAHFRPCLNVVDGIVALNNTEWDGEPLKPGVIVAGTNIVATDSVAARVMGVDPACDYPSHPFFYRRNSIRRAAGLGVGSPDEIDVVGPSPEEVAVPFTVHRYEGETDRPGQLQRGAICIERYLNDRERLLRRFEGRHIALRNGEVMWDAPDMQTLIDREKASGLDWKSVPQLVVKCVPGSEESESFDWYAKEAANGF